MNIQNAKEYAEANPELKKFEIIAGICSGYAAYSMTKAWIKNEFSGANFIQSLGIFGIEISVAIAAGSFVSTKAHHLRLAAEYGLRDKED